MLHILYLTASRKSIERGEIHKNVSRETKTRRESRSVSRETFSRAKWCKGGGHGRKRNGRSNSCCRREIRHTGKSGAQKKIPFSGENGGGASGFAVLCTGRAREKIGGEVRQGEICAAGRPMLWDLRASRRNAGGGLASRQRVRRKERKRHIGGNAVRCARKTGSRAKYAVKVKAPEYGEVAGV